MARTIHPEQEAAEAADRRAFEQWLESQCEGHESLAGHHMGETVFCDGTCTGLTTEDYADDLESLIE